MERTISTGIHADGRKWRLQKVNGMYYYDIELYDEYGHEYFVNVFRHFDLAPVIQARNDDEVRIDKIIKQLRGEV